MVRGMSVEVVVQGVQRTYANVSFATAIQND